MAGTPLWNFAFVEYRVKPPQVECSTVSKITQDIDKFIGKRVRLAKHAEGYDIKIFGKFEAGNRSGIVVRNIVLDRYEIHDVPSTEIYYED